MHFTPNIKKKPMYLRTSALYLSDSCVNGIPKSFAKSPENFKGSFFLKVFLIHQFSNLSYRLTFLCFYIVCVFTATNQLSKFASDKTSRLVTKAPININLLPFEVTIGLRYWSFPGEAHLSVNLEGRSFTAFSV
jgi:hypothetical protein